ncbi:MAG: hypothetical protein DRG63_01815 [Deltaproteobacteria bacterium]|nr:MAG: hypothetical protein DRG63_01815 [Deltaproteobacteria bacterium]
MPRITLCAPDSEKSCFACCPPIRPKGYEHIDYRNIIRRILRENTRAFDPSSKEIIPITGFSCWALGYVDDRYRQVGCLLHPARNRGKDLRYRVDYGQKCQRESCLEARRFMALSPSARLFWLGIAEGLDSFEYSSRRYNPLFRLLEWGVGLLEQIASTEKGNRVNSKTFFERYPFFLTHLMPRAHSYLVDSLVQHCGLAPLRDKEFVPRFEAFCTRLIQNLPSVTSSPTAPYTHCLDMDETLADFLRLALGMKKIEKGEALIIKQKVDQEMEAFIDQLP